MAPDYRGSGKLRDCVALITGADSGIGRAVAQVVARFGKLDVLVNNAAFREHSASLEDIDDERLHEALDTHIGGYLRMARAALTKSLASHLLERGIRVNAAGGTVVGLRLPASPVCSGHITGIVLPVACSVGAI